MAKIQLYMDEDSMDQSLVRALIARNVDVTTALTEKMIEQPDRKHLDYAASQSRTLYTFNVGDFFQLHEEYISQDKTHFGIILAPQQRYSVGEQMRRLMTIIATKTSDEMKNRVEFLSNWQKII